MAALTQRVPRLNEVVQYYRATSRKPVLGKVTAVAGSVVSLNIAGTVVTGISKRTLHNQTGVWDHV